MLTSPGRGAQLAFVLAAAAWLYLAVTGNTERRQLALLPAGLNVSKVVYAASESGRVGAGDHPSGFLVYDMPEPLAQQLASGSRSAEVDKAALGAGWQRTPAPAQAAGPVWERWQIEAPYRSMAKRGLANAGNWYSARHGEVLLLMPAERRIIYAFQRAGR